MAQNTDLNVSPYYDDYDETKNFYRILFRPSNAIQARELTQLQSIIQNQVERFGNHIFDEGALIMGGTITINKLYYAVKVNDTNPNGLGVSATETYRTAANDKYYQGKESGTVAKVVNTAAKTTDGDPLTLYVTYLSTGDGTTSGTPTNATFLDNEELEEVSLAANGTYSNAGNSNNEFKTITNTSGIEGDSVATGSAATIRSGILYIRGFFVRVEQQTILLEKYASNPSYRIGLQITESLQSSTDDGSLLDNATGSSNENAPGANRLKIELTLVKKNITGTQDIDNFIEMSRVEIGEVTKQTKVTSYNVLERTLARRTYDESGDYVVKTFNLELREHLNTKLNGGIYLKDAITVTLQDGTTTSTTKGDSTKMVGILSSGKGYVKGFEIDKPSQSFVDIGKARTEEDAGAIAVPFEIGNYYNLNNCFGQPEFGTGLSTIAPFGIIDLHDTKISSGGAVPGGLKIGKARVRFFNYQSGTASSGSHASSATNYFRIHLFDVRMFTKIIVQTHGSYALTAGQRIKGTVSGAKGTVAVTAAGSATTFYLMDIEGTFSTSDVIRLENATSGGKTIGSGSIKQYSSDDVRSLFQECRNSSGTADFTADTLLTDNQYPLSGTVKASGTALTGVNTVFTQELKVGDVIVAPSGESEIVSAVTSDTVAAIVSISAASEGKFIRQRAQLQEQEKTVAISPTPKNYVSSITPNQVTLRKQSIVTLAGATVTINPAADEAFVSEDANDYIISVHDETDSDPGTEGAIVQIGEGSTFAISSNVVTITHGQSTVLDANDVMKFTYAVQKSVSDDNSIKAINRSRGIQVTTPASTGGQSTIYGTNYDDEIISLGVPDVYALRAVFESNGERLDATTNALPPKLVVTSSSPAFAGDPGDKITAPSGAVGKIIQVAGTTVYFYYVTKDTDFVVGEVVTNATSNATDGSESEAIDSITVDSKDISNNWMLDDGQRDGYYGLASIKRKSGAPIPTQKLLIIFDYFTAGSGNFFTANSYGGLEFENYPNYIPNITDPSGMEPDGEIELGDAIDYRSYVGRLHDPATALNPTSAIDISGVALQPFAYDSQIFHTKTGVAAPVTFDLPKSGQSMTTTAMTHYLSRIDKISLSSDGQFILTAGQSADEPAAPSTPANSILLHTLYIPAYTKRLSEISVQAQDHKRFTMRDIGRIQGRVKNLERVTSLNALEQQTSLHQIQDADGLDRFKSGFVTDNFRGHKTGDVNHPDYKIGVDRTTGTLRPMHNTKFVDLSLNTGSSSGYQKTGDLITLPYTEEAYVTIAKASTTEFVNPYNVVLYNGTVALSPSRDLWFDTIRLPSIRRTVEGDYDTVLKGVGNALGTIWNNWQTDWVGEPITTVEQPPNKTVTGCAPRKVPRAATPAQRSISVPGSRNLDASFIQNWIRWEER